MSIEPSIGIENLPSWVAPLVGLYVVLMVVSKSLELFRELPKLPFSQEQRQYRELRRAVAADLYRYLLKQYDALGSDDDQFTELEAEVEAEGKRKGGGWWPFVPSFDRGRRRERSLTKALVQSNERIILLLGNPGTGKSVALRHVAMQYLAKARGSRSLKARIPIYINLRELHRDPQTQIDARLIDSFVTKSLRDIGSKQVDEFLAEAFAEERAQDQLLFLFDSFDEIPEILSSTEADTFVFGYTQAINLFLGNQPSGSGIAGIVASRPFRSPKAGTWAIFNLLELSQARQRELIRNTRLSDQKKQLLLGELPNAPLEIQKMAKTPLELRLLCDHLVDTSQFPTNTYTVYESYISRKMQWQAHAIEPRYKMSIQEVRRVAEHVAFCMAYEPDLGLEPSIGQVNTSLPRLGLDTTVNLHDALQALQEMQLARFGWDVQRQSFSFSHRRFQEFFATCVVQRDPLRVAPRELLLNGRWRETTVVLCQIQSEEHLSSLLAEVRSFLQEVIERRAVQALDIATEVTSLEERPGKYLVERRVLGHSHNPLEALDLKVFHILSLLQDAFGGRLDLLPTDIRDKVGVVCLDTSERGSYPEFKWMLEVAGTAPSKVLVLALRHAFAISSSWIQNVAYQQTAYLQRIPDDLEAAIYLAVLRTSRSVEGWQQRFAIFAHIERLEDSQRYAWAARLMVWLRPVDQLIHLFILVIGVLVLAVNTALTWSSLLGLSFGVVLSFLLLDVVPIELRKIASALFISLLPRAGLVLVIATQLAAMPDPVQIALASFVSLLILWAPTILFSLLANWAIPPAWWVFPYPLAMVRMSLAPLQFIRSFVSLFRLAPRQAFVTILFLSALLSMSAISVILAARISASTFDDPVSPSIVLVVGVAFACFLVFGAMQAFLIWWHDLWTLLPYRVKKWPVGLHEFLSMLDAVKHPLTAVEFVRSVRQRDLLVELRAPHSQEKLTVVKDACKVFIREYEHQRSAMLMESLSRAERWRQRFLTMPIIGKLLIFQKESDLLKYVEREAPPTKAAVSQVAYPKFMNDWLTKYSRQDKYRLQKLDNAFVDEIAMILELADTYEKSLDIR